MITGSYLSSRTFLVKCANYFSSTRACVCGVPKDVLGPLLFIMYTSPLSTFISSFSLNHHLYADNTQLFLSFRPPDFDSSVTHLQNALQHISSWMTANLLTLNSSKTEFLLTSLHCNNNSLKLTTAHSVPLIQFRILVSSSIVISLSLTKYHLSLSLVIIIFVNLAVSAPILTSKLPVPLPHLLFALNMITATLCTPSKKSQLNRLQVIQNSVARAVVKSPKFCHVTLILKYLYWLKISECIE